MRSPLLRYLLDAYAPRLSWTHVRPGSNVAIQIDDQDDNDNIAEFCTVFVQVKPHDLLEIVLEGRIPISDEIADLAEIYAGETDRARGRITLRVTLDQIEVLDDLATRLKKTEANGHLVDNPSWFRIAARTASSLKRFVRLIHEYR